MAVLQSDGVNHTSDLILRRNGTEGLRLTSSTVQVSSINDGPLAGNRNKIINGAMEISQRGTSFASAAGYTLDRFIFLTDGPTGGGVATVSRDTNVPNNTFQNSFRVNVTTADTSIAAGDFSLIEQRIEGYNVRDLIGQTFTLSFWVRSPKTGTHCVAFRNGGANRSYVMQYTVSTANTWEYKTLTVTGGLITAGTWNWTDGVGLGVCFTLATGSAYQTTAGAWQTGNFIGTSSQVNVMDNTANNFYLTGVQLEPGPVATPFERRPIGTEFALCQRYFTRMGIQRNIHLSTFNTTSRFVADPVWPVRMRATPTVTGTFTGGVNPGISQISVDGCHLFSDGGNCFIDGFSPATGLTISAEL